MRHCLPPLRPNSRLLLRDLPADLARRPADWRAAALALEQAYAAAHGGGEAILVPSGRDGLRFVLAHLRRPGATTVIVPALADASVLEAIALLGLKAEFCDARSDGTLDPDRLHACVGPHVLAVIVVHIWGNAAAVQRILAVTDAAGIALIEDCAHAPATATPDGYLGTFGIASFTSCAPFKSVDCGGGGLVLTRDLALADAVRRAAACHTVASRRAVFMRVFAVWLVRGMTRANVYDAIGHRLFVGLGGADAALAWYKRWIRPFLKRDADREDKPLPSLAFLRSGRRQLGELPNRLVRRQRLARKLLDGVRAGLLVLPAEGVSAYYAMVVRTADPLEELTRLIAQRVDAIASPMVWMGDPATAPVARELAATTLQLPWCDDFDDSDVQLLIAALR